jgi:2-polyprenyl-3-methyl-5-hydroxy-6-metoxy-1,4-benzoquinol methylase
MNSDKKDFDNAATTWDEKPDRVKLAKDVAHAIVTRIPLNHEMNVMDFGCGTGLLSIELLQFVRSITCVDSSQGMLDMLTMKIDKLKLKAINTMLVDLDKGDKLTGRYDIIVSNMTLHHIKEIDVIIKQLHKTVAPEGYLCVSDLDLDEGRFHEDNTGVFHFGFDRMKIKKIFTEAGFENVQDISAAEIVKPSKTGEMKHFSVFLVSGMKKSQ